METFNDIINGEIPVLVDFFATWCGPCRAMEPTIEVIGKEAQGYARVLKIDIDKNQALARHFNIQSVPTFIIFKKGAICWRHSGGLDKAMLLAEIEKAK